MGYLENIPTRIIPTEEGTIELYYGEGEYTGSVTYVNYQMENKLMKGKPVYLMVNSDMGDVIEGIHRESPLSSEDFNEINMEIRTHSRDLINSWVQSLGR